MPIPTSPPKKAPQSPLKSVPVSPGANPLKKTPNDAKQRRAEGVLGMVQLTAGVLFQVPAFRPDAAALALHGGNLANEAAELAEHDERAAALLDKITTMGPYGGLISAIAAIGFQIAANHNLIRPGMLGTMEPNKLVDHVIGGESDKSPQPGNGAVAS